jgi:hypothetical protein
MVNPAQHWRQRELEAGDNEVVAHEGGDEVGALGDDIGVEDLGERRLAHEREVQEVHRGDLGTHSMTRMTRQMQGMVYEHMTERKRSEMTVSAREDIGLCDDVLGIRQCILGSGKGHRG